MNKIPPCSNIVILDTFTREMQLKNLNNEWTICKCMFPVFVYSMTCIPYPRHYHWNQTKMPVHSFKSPHAKISNPSIIHPSIYPSINQSINQTSDKSSIKPIIQTNVSVDQTMNQGDPLIQWPTNLQSYIITKNTRFLFLSVFTLVWLHCNIIPGFHFDANLWVSNSGISNSTAAVEVGQVGNVILRKPDGGLAYADYVTNLYICEARELMQF